MLAEAVGEMEPEPTSAPPIAAKTVAVPEPIAAPPRSVGVASAPPPLPTGGSSAGVDAGVYSQRTRGRAAAVRRYGGGGATEDAVSRGLRWLAEHQDSNGGWSAARFQRHCREHVPCGHGGLAEFDVGVTSLALLAFLGAGHSPAGPAWLAHADGSSPYASVVERGLEFLVARQGSSGAFGIPGDHYGYNHALATLTMVEAYGLCQRDRYKGAATNALGWISRCQQPGGGWDYTCDNTGRNDLSISGWLVLAIHAAQQNSLTIAPGTVAAARQYIDRAFTPTGEGVYANVGLERGRRGVNMVASAVLSHLYLGAATRERRVRRAVARILEQPPNWESCSRWDRTFQSYYYWYTASLAMFHLGGDEWEAWNYYLKRTLLPLQARQGHELGSFPPEASWVGVSGGRVYSTAMAVLTLETYYRYRPLAPARKS